MKLANPWFPRMRKPRSLRRALALDPRFRDGDAMWMVARAIGFAALVLAFAFSAALAADEPHVVSVTIKDHRFTPAEIHVPAGKPVRLDIANEDPTAEEFDSAALQIEKVIAGGRKAPVRLRPLAPGRYPFIGEYNSATAQGVIIAE